MKKLLVAFSIFLSFSTFAKGGCSPELPFGVPLIKKDVIELCKTGYFSLYDAKSKIPALVTYVLEKEELANCVDRDSSFSEDKELSPNQRSTTKDYRKSGYDMGHLANAADFKWSIQAQADVALMSNMTPQTPALNRGFWRILEEETRGWASESSIAIFTGPVYSKTKSKTIGDGVVVPEAFFKILVNVNKNEAISFIAKNENELNSFDRSITTISQIQKQTGINFQFPKSLVQKKAIWAKVDPPKELKFCLTGR